MGSGGASVGSTLEPYFTSFRSSSTCSRARSFAFCFASSFRASFRFRKPVTKSLQRWKTEQSEVEPQNGEHKGSCQAVDSAQGKPTPARAYRRASSSNTTLCTRGGPRPPLAPPPPPRPPPRPPRPAECLDISAPYSPGEVISYERGPQTSPRFGGLARGSDSGTQIPWVNLKQLESYRELEVQAPRAIVTRLATGSACHWHHNSLYAVLAQCELLGNTGGCPHRDSNCGTSKLPVGIVPARRREYQARIMMIGHARCARYCRGVAPASASHH